MGTKWARKNHSFLSVIITFEAFCSYMAYVNKYEIGGSTKKDTGMSDAEIQAYLRQQNLDKMDRVYGTQDTSEQPTTPQTPAPTYTAPSTPSTPAPAVDDSYNQMRAYMEQMYAQQRAQQEAAYQNTLNQLANSYNQGRDSVNRDSDDALRSAYINYMMGKKNLNQDLANNGITGGATESVLSQLYNAYGSNRTNIDKTRNNNLADLAARYNQSVAEAGNSYGGDYTNLLNNYYNNMLTLEQNHANTLENLARNAAQVSGRTTATANSITSDAVADTSRKKWNGYTEDEILNSISTLRNSPSLIRDYLELLDATNGEKEAFLVSAGIDPATFYADLLSRCLNQKVLMMNRLRQSGTILTDSCRM